MISILGKTSELWDEASVLFEHRNKRKAKDLLELDKWYPDLMHADGIKEMGKRCLEYSEALETGIKPHGRQLAREFAKACSFGV